MTPDERLDLIEQREQAATEGPWEMFRYSNGGGRIHLSGDDGRERTLIADMNEGADQVATAYNQGDREFLFAARDDVPWLIGQLRDARAEIERLTSIDWQQRQDWLVASTEKITAELAAERAKVQRVEALCVEWGDEPWPEGRRPIALISFIGHVEDALTGGEQGE